MNIVTHASLKLFKFSIIASWSAATMKAAADIGLVWQIHYFKCVYLHVWQTNLTYYMQQCMVWVCLVSASTCFVDDVEHFCMILFEV